MTRIPARALPALVACLCALSVAPARAAPDHAGALAVFNEAAELCERDGGALWGQSLCGPIMVVDPADRGVIANQADADGILEARDGAFTGVLPADAVMANTRVEWAGTEWTQLLWPVPFEPTLLRVYLVHEMFHRIQPGLGLTRPEAGNRHLDTLEGRYLLQLEWRALARALMADAADARRGHISDALAFRHERRRLFPRAAADEAALETTEGIAEYTGVRIGLSRDEQRRAYAVYALSRFLDSPSFVRSFAYATGPAYGLLLDDVDPAWRDQLGPDVGADFATLLTEARQVAASPPASLAMLAARYDADGSLRAAEEAREAERTARVAAWRAMLVEGPVLVLPLANARFQFNPQTLAALDDIGTVYPTLRLADDWGELTVDGGAALVHADGRRAAVALVQGGDAVSGDGWQLALAPGWRIVPGEREGDSTVAPSAGEPPR